MNRRQFCAGIASMLGVSASAPFTRAAATVTGLAGQDPDPAGGYTVQPRRQVLFVDYRDIHPGDLAWRSPEGAHLPVAGPPEPPVPAHADLNNVARGIRLVAQPARKEGPIDGLPNLIHHDGGVYRSWGIRANYPAGHDLGSYSVTPPRSVTIRYGQSDDGYQWTWRDTCDVNVSGISGIDGGYFFIDPNAPPEQRYKCIYNARVFDNVEQLWKQYQRVHPRHRDVRLSADSISCLFGMVSPDGLHWTALPEPLLIHKGDTDNTVYHDAWLGKYVLYTRLYWMSRRMVARAESDDFVHWTPVEPVVWPDLNDPFTDDVYTNGRTCYPGLPDVHLMFPILYQRYTQTSKVHLHASVDGVHWNRIPGGPVLTHGDPGQWDGAYIVAGKNLVPLSADRVAIPYSGGAYPHKYPRWPSVMSGAGGAGWAWWPRGRLCALAAEDEGQFSTFEITTTGRQLRLNARVQRAGEIRVGVIRIKGRSADECDAIFGDDPAHMVQWMGNGDIGVEPGTSVRLHFKMRAAELFGFEWV